MDAGLSARMSKALDTLLPRVTANQPPKNYDASTAIDLSTAQNELLRTELVEFFKTTVEDKVTNKTFSLPPANGGDVDLREALAFFFNSYFNPIHQVLPQHIVLTGGASDALESLIHAICDEDDCVIISGPYWYEYDTIFGARNVKVLVAHPPTYQRYENYLLPSLQAAYNFYQDKSRIKAVVMCNPTNPLAQCWPKQALVECLEFCQENGLHLILDEILALNDLNTAPDDAPLFISALSLTEPLVPEGAVKVDPSRVHVVWSASKLFGSSGFRVGCVISQQNPQLCEALALITNGHVNNIAALYLTSLLTWPQLPTLLALNSERLTESFHLVADALSQWKIDFVMPTNGICLFAKLGKDVKSLLEDKAFFNRLAVQGVRVSPGRLYNGCELGWARICFSVPPEVMHTALERIASFLLKEAA